MSLTPVSTQYQTVNFFQTIPQDVYFNIFSRIFSLNEIRSLLFTDWGINTFISSTDALWSNFIVTHFHFPLQSIPISLPFKDFYKLLKIVNQNIKAGNYLFESFEAQEGGISCLALYKDKCISGSNGGAIKVWDAKTKKELHTFIGHRGGFTISLTVSGSTLIAGYDDGVVQCWDLDTYKETHKFVADARAIHSFAVHQDLLVIAASEIILWDLKNNKKLDAFEAGRERIPCVTVFEDLLIIGSYTGAISIWDRKNKRELHSFNAHDGSVNAMLVKDNMLITCSDDKTIKIWNLNDFQELETLKGHQGWVNGLETFGDYLFSCSDDHTVKVWDLKSRKELHSIRGHKKLVNCVTMKDGRLYSGSNDKTIHVYNFNHDQPLKAEE